MSKFLGSILIIVFSGIAITITVILVNSSQDIPPGEGGKPAELLSEQIQKAVNTNAWDRTAAVEFTVSSSQNRHFIDKKRKLYEVQFSEGNDTYLVQFDDNNHFTAYRNDEKLSGSELQNAYETAKTARDTDLFWFHPFPLIRKNTILKKVGNQALLVTFTQKDNDTYLIVTDASHRPTHWKMWTKKYPLKGMESSFDEWVKIGNGISLSLLRQNDFQEIRFTDAAVHEYYPVKEDRFRDFLIQFPHGE